MTRLRRRRERIQGEIKFFLEIIRNGQWTSNKEIIEHLDFSSRGMRSYNSLTTSQLGQYMRAGLEPQHRIKWLGSERSVQYRMINNEEE